MYRCRRMLKIPWTTKRILDTLKVKRKDTVFDEGCSSGKVCHQRYIGRTLRNYGLEKLILYEIK